MVVELIITSRGHTSESDVNESDYWRDSLRNTSRGKDGTETTPFRRLIRRMPGKHKKCKGVVCETNLPLHHTAPTNLKSMV